MIAKKLQIDLQLLCYHRLFLEGIPNFNIAGLIFISSIYEIEVHFCIGVANAQAYGAFTI